MWRYTQPWVFICFYSGSYINNKTVKQIYQGIILEFCERSLFPFDKKYGKNLITM